VTFGPHVWNFQDTAARLEDAGAAIRVADATDLERVTRRLLADRAEREKRGALARQFVLGQQGATHRTLEMLDELLAQGLKRDRAA
jgi:3-deoxy-D-manno-octulosonic-acid transferase